MNRINSQLFIVTLLLYHVIGAYSNTCHATSTKNRFLRLIGINAYAGQCPQRTYLSNLEPKENPDPSSNWFVCTPGWTEKFGNGKEWQPVVRIVDASLFFSSSTNSQKTATTENQNRATETDNLTNVSNTTQDDENATKQPQNKTADSSKSNTDNWCMMVNFFSPTCSFSAKLAPAYNALARAFPEMFIAAVDATQNVKLNLVYGISGTPTILLFQNGRPVARYDQLSYDLSSLIGFVEKITDLTPIYGVKVSEDDLQGPLSSEMPDKYDPYLLICIYFLLFCTLYHLARSSFVKTLIDALKRNWREMNEE